MTKPQGYDPAQRKEFTIEVQCPHCAEHFNVVATVKADKPKVEDVDLGIVNIQIHKIEVEDRGDDSAKDENPLPEEK